LLSFSKDTIHHRPNKKEGVTMNIVTKFNELRLAFLETKMLQSVHPGYRRETLQDEERLQRYRPLIAHVVLKNSTTDRWRIHALRGQINGYHITPNVGGTTYLVRLEDDHCFVERILFLQETCSPTT